MQTKSIIDSVLSKNIKSTANDKKQIKHASTELLYDTKTSQALTKYQDIVNHIQDKSGTTDEAVVLCCMTRTNNPVSYQVVEDGPLDITAEKLEGARYSKSCDLMCFGPVYTSLHADINYSHRNSLIPSWNCGVVKIWIIHKKCNAKTNREVPTAQKQREAKGFKPIYDLTKVLEAKKDYVLLIQRPGQLIRHNGRHVHCVITAIDLKINPTGFSLSIGRKDLYVNDIFAYATGSRDTSISDNCKQASREHFINTQLNAADQKKLGVEFEKAKQLRQKGRKRRRRGGFQRGNKAAKKAKKENTVSKLTLFLPSYFLYFFFVKVSEGENYNESAKEI